MRRIWLVALLFGATLVVGSPAAPTHAAGADPDYTYRFLGDPWRIVDTNLWFQPTIVTRPGTRPLLSVRIFETSDPAGRAEAERSITYSQGVRFLIDSEFDDVRLLPTAEQMGNHGAISMRWVAPRAPSNSCHQATRYQEGAFKGKFEFRATIGTRPIAITRTQLPGLLRREQRTCGYSACPPETVMISGTNTPGDVDVEATGNGYDHLDARRALPNTPSGWQVLMDIDADLPRGSVTLNDAEQLGQIRGAPGTFTAYASKYTADGPTQDTTKVCRGYGGYEYPAYTYKSHGSLTKANDNGSLELRWINQYTSRWYSDDAYAMRTTHGDDDY